MTLAVLGRSLARGALHGIVLTALAVPPLAQGQEVAYDGSIQLATGSYLFTERTDSFYFLNGLDLSVGRLHLQASVPVVMQSTPWISYGPTPIPSGGNESGEVSRQISGRGGNGQGTGGRQDIQLPTGTPTYETGIADPLIRGDVEVLRTDAGSLTLGLGGSVKLPVATPDDGFATGEWDYSGGVSVSTWPSDRDSVFADLAYQTFGDMPDLAFRNALAYSLAYGRTVSPNRWSVLASVYGMTPILENSDPPVQLGFGVTRFFDAGRSMNVNVAVGLTETVPDVAGGLGWRLGL